MKCYNCGAELHHYAGHGYWYCPNNECPKYTLYYDRGGNLIRETLVGFSPLRLNQGLNGSRKNEKTN